MIKKSKQKKEVIIFLYNIRSVHNAGAIMRTADAIGASQIIFGGYTPAPVDRFGRTRKDFTKASLGAEYSVLWKIVPDPDQELKNLQEAGCRIIAVEQAKHSVDYKNIEIQHPKTVVVFGNEPEGLPPSVLKLADIVAEIPMHGKKESLNVSVAAGIILYRWFDT